MHLSLTVQAEGLALSSTSILLFSKFLTETPCEWFCSASSASATSVLRPRTGFHILTPEYVYPIISVMLSSLYTLALQLVRSKGCLPFQYCYLTPSTMPGIFSGAGTMLQFTFCMLSISLPWFHILHGFVLSMHHRTFRCRVSLVIIRAWGNLLSSTVHCTGTVI